jgi:hypothetical protein
MTEKQLTYGEMACGVSFNPGGNHDVDSIKRAFAAIVDDLNDRRQKANLFDQKETARMLSIAITEAQTAQMWAVKAVTWQFN